MHWLDLPDALIAIGGIAVVVSAWLIYPPLGGLILGVELMIVGILATRK